MIAGGDGSSAAAAVLQRHGGNRVVRLVLALALCGLTWWWLLRHADLHALAASADALPAWAWLAAGAALVAGHGARALRLQRDWRHLRFVSWWQCLRIVLGHNALVLLMPLRSGEGAYLWAVRRQWGVTWRAAGLGLLRWRLQDAAVLAVLAVTLLAPWPWPWRWLCATAAAVVIYGALPPLWRWLVERAGGAADGLPAGGSPWQGMPASLVNWTLKLLANGGLLAALSGLAPWVAWRAALGGELAGVQPLQPPVGLGTYEAGVWLAAAQPAGMAPRIVAAALAVHAFSLAVALGAAALGQLALPAGRMTEEPCP